MWTPFCLTTSCKRTLAFVTTFRHKSSESARHNFTFWRLVSKSCDECKGSFARGCEAKRCSHWTCSSLGTIFQPMRINSIPDVKCFYNNKHVLCAQPMVWHFVRHSVYKKTLLYKMAVSHWNCLQILRYVFSIRPIKIINYLTDILMIRLLKCCKKWMRRNNMYNLYTRRLELSSRLFLSFVRRGTITYYIIQSVYNFSLICRSALLLQILSALVCMCYVLCMCLCMHYVCMYVRMYYVCMYLWMYYVCNMYVCIMYVCVYVFMFFNIFIGMLHYINN